MTKKTKKTIVPTDSKVATVEYLEGADGFVTVKYSGTTKLRVVGCKTGNKYFFGEGSIRKIDANDAKCLFDLMPGYFIEEVVKVAKSSYRKSESESRQDEPITGQGDD